MLDSLRPRAVHPARPGRGQRGNGGLAEQRVPELHPAGATNEHARQDSAGQPVVEVLRRQVDHRRQIGGTQFDPSHGGRVDHRTSGRGQVSEPVAEKAVGQLVEMTRAGGHQLLHQQGHPARNLGDALDVRRPGGPSGAELENLGSHVLRPETAQVDPRGAAQTAQLGDVLAHLVVGRVVGAHGQHHRQLLLTHAADQVVEHVATRLVRPVHVLQDEQQRLLQGHVAQQSRGRSLDPGRAQRHRSPHRLLLQLGQQPTHVGKTSTGHRIEPARAQRAAQIADDVQEGTERHVAAAGCAAVTPQDAHVAPAELVDELAHQTGLADTGLTQHQHSTRLATSR